MQMRRLLAVLLAAVMVLTLAACGNSSSTQDPSDNTKAQETTAAGTESTGSATASEETSDQLSSDASDIETADTKILVVYFSWSGHLDSMAHWVADETGGDLYRVTAKDPYPENYNQTADRAKQEQDNDVRPEIVVDMENRIINIDHQLQRTSKMEYVISSTKTNAGTRKLPMTDGVYYCFQSILEDRETPRVEKVVDGHVGFLYLDKDGMPEVAMHWQHRFNHAVERYNEIYKEQMPNITPHVCRHTYCSNMAKAGMNPKTLQYLMGCGRPVDDAAKQQHGPSRQTRPFGHWSDHERIHPPGP